MAPSSNCEQSTNENNVDSQSVGVPDIEKMGGKMLINKMAGEGVVKVIKRVENAKETLKLGKSIYLILINCLKFKTSKFTIFRPFRMQLNQNA